MDVKHLVTRWQITEILYDQIDLLEFGVKSLLYNPQLILLYELINNGLLNLKVFIICLISRKSTIWLFLYIFIIVHFITLLKYTLRRMLSRRFIINFILIFVIFKTFHLGCHFLYGDVAIFVNGTSSLAFSTQAAGLSHNCLIFRPKILDWIEIYAVVIRGIVCICSLIILVIFACTIASGAHVFIV